MRALIAVALAVGLAAQGPDGSPSLVGRWRVSAVLASGPVTALLPEEAAKMVGQPLIVGERDLRFAGQTCEASFKRTSLRQAEFEREYAVPLKNVRLTAPVTAVDAGCTTLLLRDQKTLVFDWDGFLFEASRAPALPTN